MIVSQYVGPSPMECYKLKNNSMVALIHLQWDVIPNKKNVCMAKRAIYHVKHGPYGNPYGNSPIGPANVTTCITCKEYSKAKIWHPTG